MHPTHTVIQSKFDAQFNQTLYKQFCESEQLDGIKKTHQFNGRYENIYLDEQHAPNLSALKVEAQQYAEKLLENKVVKLGCWFNAMPAGASTTLHSHDEDDERLSGVYYIRAPARSGQLIIHATERTIYHTPVEGQWIFFSPKLPHEVTENLSNELRLSVAFNFS